MTPPVLCIIQARYHSTRLPGKMLADLGGETLIARGWRLACEAFGAENVVIATPKTEIGLDDLDREIARIGALQFAWPGPENDVLGRFHACAHRYRWHPDSVIVRWTPDDPFKDPAMCRRVAAGERLPVELGAEAFTLRMLDEAWESSFEREHITHAIFPTPPSPCQPGVWTIDTPADLEAARARLAADS